MPLCAPQVAAALRAPADLAAPDPADHRHARRHRPSRPSDWEPWLEIMGLPELRMKNTMRFTHYTDAVGGRGGRRRAW